LAQLKDLIVTGKARFLNGLYGDVSGNVLNYGVCNSSGNSSTKEATIVNGTFTLTTGSEVFITFTNRNIANNPTLNINGTGAKSIIFASGKQPSNGDGG
jgi:hypothetical protein